MPLRSFINAILQFISVASITDEEFDALTITEGNWDQATYKAIADMLAARDLVSGAQDRLEACFKARGVDVAPINKARSNILVGAPL